MIRALEIPGLQQTAVRDPEVSPAAAMAPAAALGSVAGAIGGVSDAFAAVAERIQRTENAFSESTTRNQWLTSWSDHLLQLQKEPDPAKHITLTRDWLQQQRGTLDAPDLAPVVRDNLRLQFDEFAGKAISKAAESAAVLSTRRMTLALENEFEGAMRTGNRAQHERARQTAAENNIFLPEQLDRMDSDFEQSVIANDAMARAEIEPEVLLREFDEAVPEGSLDPATRRRIKATAESNLGQLRNEEMDLLDEAVRAQTLRPSDVEAASYISERDRRAYLTHIEKNIPPTREALGTQWDRLDVLRQARNDSGITPEMYRELYYETKSGVLAAVSPAYQGELAKELSYLSPAGRNAAMEKGADAPFTKEDRLGIGRSVISRARSANAFGDIENGSPEVKEKAYRKAEDAELELNRFVAANPDATPDEIRAHADALISGDRTTTNTRSLRSFVPGSGGSLRGAVFPPLKGVDAPAGQGESDDLLLPPRDDLDQFLNDGN